MSVVSGGLIDVKYLGQVMANKGGLSCRPLKVKVWTKLFGIKGHADRHSAWFDILPGLTALPKEFTSD